MSDVCLALRELGLSGRAVCLHSSLRSFGTVVGGAATIVQAFLEAGCTLIAPTYSYWAWTAPPEIGELRPKRNGWDYGFAKDPATRSFSTTSTEVSPDMGTIAATIGSWPGRIRGANPGVSFSATGPSAETLISCQSARDPFAPIRALAQAAGFVVLAGVGLERMSLLHAAEQNAGRVPFVRWALTDTGIVAFRTGGCSEGFGNLFAVLDPYRIEKFVGESRWWVFPAAKTLEVASSAIRLDSSITHCGDSMCERCNDAVPGGPLL